MKLLSQLSEKIDALSLRERAIILLAVLAAMYSVWDAVLMRPLQLKQISAKNSIQEKNADVVLATAELQAALRQSKDDPNAENRKRLNELKKTMSSIEVELQQITSHMVAPENMAKVLETVLNNTSGLRLLGLAGLGSSPLVASDKEQIEYSRESPGKQLDNSSIDTAFKHGFRLTFSGDYFSTLRYLEKLEKLGWKFYWDSIEYNVDEYPNATTTISIYTVSLKPNWIGV